MPGPVQRVGPIRPHDGSTRQWDRPAPAPRQPERVIYRKPTAADRPAPRDVFWRNNGEIS